MRKARSVVGKLIPKSFKMRVIVVAVVASLVGAGFALLPRSDSKPATALAPVMAPTTPNSPLPSPYVPSPPANQGGGPSGPVIGRLPSNVSPINTAGPVCTNPAVPPKTRGFDQDFFDLYGPFELSSRSPSRMLPLFSIEEPVGSPVSDMIVEYVRASCKFLVLLSDEFWQGALPGANQPGFLFIPANQYALQHNGNVFAVLYHHPVKNPPSEYSLPCATTNPPLIFRLNNGVLTVLMFCRS
jgi:hypothetical protein